MSRFWKSGSYCGPANAPMIPAARRTCAVGVPAPEAMLRLIMPSSFTTLMRNEAPFMPMFLPVEKSRPEALPNAACAPASLKGPSSTSA